MSVNLELDSMLRSCDWPDKDFTFSDEPGEHDPCYVIQPGGSMMALNDHAAEGVDIARAKFIIEACNEKLARLRRGDEQTKESSMSQVAILAAEAFSKNERVRMLELMNTPQDYDERKKAFIELAEAREAAATENRLLDDATGTYPPTRPFV